MLLWAIAKAVSVRIAFVVLGGGSVLAQTVTQDWASPPRDTGPVNAPDTNKMLAVDPGNGSAFITGQKIVSLTKTQISTWKYNDDGSLAAGWPKVWPENPDGKSYGVAVVTDGASPNGVFVTGAFTKAGQGLDIVVLHYDSNGNLTTGFPYTYNNTSQSGDDYPVAASYDNDGGIWVAGVSAGYGTGSDYITIGVNSANGNVLGVPQRFDHTSHKSDTAVDIQTQTVFSVGSSVRRVVVTGTSFDNETKDDIYTVEYSYDPSTGILTQSWDRRYGGATKETAASLALAQMPGTTDPSVYVCGSKANALNGKSDVLVLGYPRTIGTPPDPWAREYNGPGNNDDIAVKIATAYSNDLPVRYVLVAGSSVGSSGTFDFAVTAYRFDDGTTPLLWPSAYRSGLSADDRVSDMIAIDEGSIYVTGQWYNGSNYDYRVEKVRLANGLANEWTGSAIYNFGVDYPASICYRRKPIEDYAESIRLADIYLVGRNTPLYDVTFKYATIKFVQSD